MHNPKVIFVKGLVFNEETSSMDWVMKLFSAMDIDHDVGIAQIRVLANFRVLRVVLSTEEEVQVIMRRKSILRTMPEFRNIFVDMQRPFEERKRVYLQRIERRQFNGQSQEGPWRTVNVGGKYPHPDNGDLINRGRAHFGATNNNNSGSGPYGAWARGQDHLNMMRPRPVYPMHNVNVQPIHRYW